MKTKNLLITALTIFTLFANAQRKMGGASKKAFEHLKASKLQVSVGNISEDYDSAVKDALERYWTLCPLEFVDNKSLDKKIPTLLTANYEVKSYTRSIFTKLTFAADDYLSFTFDFDNLTVKDECLGIDKTETELKYKCVIAIMNLCAQLKMLEPAIANKDRSYLSFDGYKEKLKTTTVLIPKEYLTNGLTKNAFKKLPKHEFVSLEEINKRIMDKNTKGYAVLNTYRTIESGSFLNIIDIDTGDFLLYREFGFVTMKGNVSKQEKVTDKDIIKELEKL